MGIVAGGLGPVAFILIGCAKEMPYIIFSIISLIWGVYMVIDDYCSNCIQYGNGRIIIKRRNKKIVNGRPEAPDYSCCGRRRYEIFWYFEDIEWFGRLSVIDWGDYTYRQIIDILEIAYTKTEEL